MPESAMVQLTGVRKEYQTGEVITPVLRSVDVAIEHGEFVGVLGPSGCGKTTLLNLIGALDVPTEGTIVIDEMNLSQMSRRELTDYRRTRVGFIFQFYNLIPTLTAVENVEVALAFKPFPSHPSRKRAQRDHAMAYLEMVQLADKPKHFVSQLSGGEQQRVAIARALAREPKLILADEPTGNLDAKTGGAVFSLFKDLRERLSVTCLVVTHNQELAGETDRILELRHGKIA